MTDTQKIIDILLPELLQQLDNEDSSDLSQKGLDNNDFPSIHCGKKGV